MVVVKMVLMRVLLLLLLELLVLLLMMVRMEVLQMVLLLHLGLLEDVRGRLTPAARLIVTTESPIERRANAKRAIRRSLSVTIEMEEVDRWCS